MPTDVQHTTDAATAFVKRANSFYLYSPSADQLLGDRAKLYDPSSYDFSNEWSPNNPNLIRDASNPDHLTEDLAHLHMKHPDNDKPILDYQSFLSGYRPQEHPVEFVVRDSEGRLKQRVHSHNIRTNIGGAWQGLLMSGDIPANSSFTGTGHASTAPTATTYTVAGTPLPTASSVTTANWPGGGLVGHLLIVGGVYGVIASNTSSAATIDKWHIPALSTVDGVGTIPGTGATYTITPGQSPAMWLGLSSGNTAVGTGDYSGTSTDWTTGELSTSVGLGRAATATTAGVLATYSWNSASPTGGTTATVSGAYKLVQTFTATSTGGTVQKSGIFNTGVINTGLLIFEAVLLTPATLAALDTLQVTWQINF